VIFAVDAITLDMTRSAKEKTIPGGKYLLDEGVLPENRPMALPHEDTSPPRDGTTGLQYKFQGSSATVTYSRF